MNILVLVKQVPDTYSERTLRSADGILASALTTVTSVAPRPPKSAGEKTADEGDGGSKIAAYLVARTLGEPFAVVVATPGAAGQLTDGLKQHGAEKIYLAETATWASSRSSSPSRCSTATRSWSVL